MRTELKGGGMEDLSQSETEGQGGGGVWDQGRAHIWGNIAPNDVRGRS